MKVFDTPFIPSDSKSENPFSITIFSSLSLSKISKELTIRRRKRHLMKLFEKDDKIDVVLDPKTIPPQAKE